ncbi:MAG: cupin domain-containing protein [Actinomycetota bacterium]|nr:cupin domain-containing protein [Actinomycetota bacterium]
MRLIRALDLAPHPEGGYYRETFRAEHVVEAFPGGQRAASTAIYYLLPAGSFSALHRVRWDEAWHHYGGDPVDLHLFEPSRAGDRRSPGGRGVEAGDRRSPGGRENLGDYRVVRLGSRWDAGERPQHVVPGGVWQAAVTIGDRFALCGCTVAPGFDFADFELASRADLLDRFPGQRAVIASLTRS